ncbi:MAG: hypothetical protein HYV07_28665 [Deltaproteobacteria bacterium]|nr:hypothetical protein [Deltaproteobacteria bacterium]
MPKLTRQTHLLDDQPPPLDDAEILKGDLVVAPALSPTIPAPASSRFAWHAYEMMRLL